MIRIETALTPNRRAVRFLLAAAAATPLAAPRAALVPAASPVQLLRVPDGGLQPQAIAGARGVVHLVYFKGDPAAGDVYYARLEPGRTAFSTPVRVNSQPGSVLAIGTMRGPQFALGRDGRIHVVWNGSDKALPRAPRGAAPLLYSRSDSSGSAFEPQRNLIQFTRDHDGGSVAADAKGDVYAVWHAAGPATRDESTRRLWIARSTDDGRTFSREAPAHARPAGACGCCGTRAFVDRNGALYVMYRSAMENVHRDIVLLVSRNRGRTFQDVRLDTWRINACPMSTESFAQGPGGLIAAWETRGQVRLARVDPATLRVSGTASAPGAADPRKHPSVAAGPRGDALFVWTEGTGWQRGGGLAWQLYDRNGRPAGDRGRLPGAIPVWGSAAAVALPGGRYAILY